MIDKFDGEYSFLSNFYPVRITREGLTYPTLEHAYVASKTYDQRFKEYISRIPAHQAGKAKRMGSSKGMQRFNCTIKPNWDSIWRDETMYELLKLKFNYKELAKKLLETKGEKLIEGNYWHDNYWGNCFCNKCVNINGQNKLGQMLMDIRRNMLWLMLEI